MSTPTPPLLPVGCFQRAGARGSGEETEAQMGQGLGQSLPARARAGRPRRSARPPPGRTRGPEGQLARGEEAGLPPGGPRQTGGTAEIRVRGRCSELPAGPGVGSGSPREDTPPSPGRGRGASRRGRPLGSRPGSASLPCLTSVGPCSPLSPVQPPWSPEAGCSGAPWGPGSPGSAISSSGAVGTWPGFSGCPLL